MTAGASSGAPALAGRRRRLLRLGGPAGIVAGIAIDHRDSLRVTLERRGLGSLPPDDLRQLKLRLAAVLAPAATAVMLDAELGGLALEQGVVPASVGLIMPLEAQGYEAGGDERITTLLTDFSPAVALDYGADACKLLVPYRADDEATSAHQDAVVRSAADACHELGLPLVVEPVVYRRSTESAVEHAAAYEALVVRAVARLQPLGADLLKLPFPVADAGAIDERCRRCGLPAARRGVRGHAVGPPRGRGRRGGVRRPGPAGRGGRRRGLPRRTRDLGPGAQHRPRRDRAAGRGSGVAALERCRAVAERHARPLPGRS